MLYLLDGICSNATMADVMDLVQLVMKVICILVPIVMIVLGTFDLFKAVTAGKEEDIKKKQKALITRLIAGVLVFLVPTIVSLLTSLMGTEDWKDCWNANTGHVSDLFKGTVKNTVKN